MHTRYGIVPATVVASVALLFVGCGDEEPVTTTETTETTKTKTETTTSTTTVTTKPKPEPTDTTTSEPPATAPVAPVEPIAPVDEGSSGVPVDPSAGETADLPLCSEGPPPCRDG